MADNINLIWGREISNLDAKQKTAQKLALRLKKNDVVGVGSGSTSFLTVKALAVRKNLEGVNFTAMPTSIELAMICSALNIPVLVLGSTVPNWMFDGADEVDPKGNLIKGRGGAMFKEKILMKSCKEIYIVIDSSKKVSRLGEKFPVPIEIRPEAYQIALNYIKNLPYLEKATVRQAIAKDGPIITEAGNLIVDAKFKKISNTLETEIKKITGVIESGLFTGYKTKIIVSS